MNRLAVVIATVFQPSWYACARTWADQSLDPFTRRVIKGKPLLEAYQEGLETTVEPILGYCHDDVVVEERGWDRRMLAEFDDPEVGLVGFAGGHGLGDLDIYKKPYRLIQLARRGMRSNMRDAEQHGQRFAGECDVASLDGFAMFVRRQLLMESGGRKHYQGWPLGTPIGYFMYDAWLSCEAKRQGWRTRLVGVACQHLNGKSTGLGPQKLGQAEFEAAHRYIYDTCRDVLPLEVKP
jgi:hypothetical protein